MIELVKDNIKLRLEEPQEGYLGSRFDWTGKAVQLWWKDIPFCTSEMISGDQKNKGCGFFNEFGMNDPLGYDTCKVGECFPKIGVGLLQKEAEEPYNFFHPYTSKPFEYSEVRSADSVIFHCLNKDFDSAFFLEKRFAITENGFTIDYLLENVGNRIIKTSEYTHNFLAPGGKAISKDTKLMFPGKVNASQFKKGLNIGQTLFHDSNSLGWKHHPNEDFFFENIAKPNNTGVNWTLMNESLRIGISEAVDFNPSKINLWGRGHVVSPEVFKSIHLLPGEKDCWQRKYQIVQL